jgi:hypothetical protein
MHIDSSKPIRDQGVEGRPRKQSDADDEGDEMDGLGWDESLFELSQFKGPSCSSRLFR